MKRTRKYSKDCIAEVICEVRFAPDSLLTSEELASIADSLSADYPERQEIFHTTLHLGFTKTGPNASQTKEITGYKLSSPDALNIVQVKSDLLSVHRLAPYDHWENLKPRIEQALTFLWRDDERVKVQQLSLRYLNVFPLRGPERLERLFHFHPAVPHGPNEHLVRFSLRADILSPDVPDRILVVMLSSGTPGKQPTIILDLQSTWLLPAETWEAASSQLADSHSSIGTAFERYITDALREEYFNLGGENNSANA